MRGQVSALFLAGLVVFGVSSASADSLSMSSKARVQLFEKQLDVLDGRAAQQYNGSTRLLPDYPELGRFVAPRGGGGGGRDPGVWLEPAKAAARRHGVPEDLFLRLVRQESGWNPEAVSHKGAIGLAQLMPDTARYLRVDPNDPRQNLEGGARYLIEQYRRFGSWRLALAAYNAGPEAVAKHGDIPPYRETQGYVRAILGR
jgi:soluble lytic murein transglycosylase-like protein